MLEFVQTESFRRWLDNLKARRARTLIAARLFRRASGLPGDVKHVGEGVCELRIHSRPGYRIYYKQKDMLIILRLCGGDKSSQDRDILLAKMLARIPKLQAFICHE